MGWLTWSCQFFSIQLLLLYSQCYAKLCSHDQSSALLQFKKLFSIKHFSDYCDALQQSYPKMKYWKEENDCCSWEGVTCDMITGHVIGLDLSCSRLYGEIPFNNSLFFLPHLTNLNLAYNDFNFSHISPGFSQFPSLKLLNLSSCNFIGSIPASLGNLTQLTHLDLSYNDFTPDHAPTSLSSLKQLRYLNLWGNNLIGKIPDMFANLTQLSYLDFSYNQLNGPIPYSLSGLPNLATIDLYNNSLRGIIPSWLFTLPSLQQIDLGQNQLIGSIPSSLFELENLTYLSLSSNNLSGKVELNMFTRFRNLQLLDLSYNSLSVSTTMKDNSSFSKLYGLILSACNVSEFPNILRPLHQLRILGLSNNKIHDTIPKWMWNVGKDTLVYLDLSHNFLTAIDHIPWKNLRHLDLQFNRLQGSLMVLPPSLIFFSVSNNKLTGEIPSSFSNFSSIMYLDFSRNNFHGPIPQTFGSCSRLEFLNLNGNQLEGPLSPSLVNCSYLQILDVGNNKINDTFPLWLTTLSQLQVVILRSNRFRGPICSPNTRISFTMLRILDLSRNKLSGVLPTVYFENFEAMIHGDYNSVAVEYIKEISSNEYYSALLTVKGNDMEMEKILTTFTIIDLSSNRFQGEIPEVVGKLNSLKVLNISHNSLTGPIPPSLGNLKALESLDLSFNKLVEKIPWQLTSMNFLQVLKLSYNQLVGAIPRENHFDTFPNDSYIGNSGLCGFPLSKACVIYVTPESSSTTEDYSESENGISWKAVLMGYGCGMVLGMSMAYVAISTGKPRLLAKIAEGVYGRKVGRQSYKRRNGSNF